MNGHHTWATLVSCIRERLRARRLMRTRRVALLVVLMPVALVCAQEKDQPQRQNSLPPGTKLLRDLEYVPNGHERQKLDLYLPEKAPQRPLPVIVWINGGGWRGGSKER